MACCNREESICMSVRDTENVNGLVNLNSKESTKSTFSFLWQVSKKLKT